MVRLGEPREEGQVDVAKVFEFPVAEFYKQPRSLLGPGPTRWPGPRRRRWASATR